MRLYEFDFKSEKDFDEWLKRRHARDTEFQRQKHDREHKTKDSPFWRGYYAGKDFVPNTLDKIKRSYIGQTFKKISDLGKGS